MTDRPQLTRDITSNGTKDFFDSRIKDDFPALYADYMDAHKEYWSFRDSSKYIVYFQIGLWVVALIIGFFFIKNVIVNLFTGGLIIGR